MINESFPLHYCNILVQTKTFAAIEWTFTNFNWSFHQTVLFYHPFWKYWCFITKGFVLFLYFPSEMKQLR